MAWTNGLILGVGALLIAVPVILHFLMQPKPKKMIFPAVRFLKQRHLMNRSRTRLRHILLLLLRCLLILLVALALAGPSVASRDFGSWLTVGGIGFSGLVVAIVLLLAFWRPQKSWLLVGILSVLLLGHIGFGGWSTIRLLQSKSATVIGDDQAPIAALIVLDTSPRMQYRKQNQTRLEVAQETAQWLISQFPLDSQVSIIATDGDRPFFSVDVASASHRVKTLETTYIENSIPAALADGLQILNQVTQERKEVYVITDMTKQSWTGDSVKPVLRTLQNDSEISLFVIDLGIENPTNFALSSLQIPNSEITSNNEFSLTAQINKIGQAERRTVRISIEQPNPNRPVVRDGQAIFPTGILEEKTQTVDLRENGSAEIPFRFRQPLPAGTYHGKVEIEGQDGLTIDDNRYFSFRVRPAWKILIVHPEDVSPRNLISTIAPTIQQELGNSAYECTVKTQAELDEVQNLNQFEALFLLDPMAPTEKQWLQLENYVVNGGGLAICLGHHAAQGSGPDPSFTSDVAQRLLAGSLDQQWLNEERDLFLSPHNFAHPLFRSFRGIETGLLWNRFPVFQHWGLEPDELSNELPTQTLLSFSNREPALIERQLGSGRILIMLTPISERSFEPNRRVWNELFVGKFLPAWMLVRAMTTYLVQQDAESMNLAVGQIIRFQNDLRYFPETYQVFSPQTDKPTTMIQTIDNQIRYRFTDQPGHYRLKGTFDQQPTLRGCSVNLVESSTDLTRLDLDELDGILGSDRYQLAKKISEIQRQQGTTRRGQEFYPLLLLMMLVVISVEYLMSNRFYKS